MVEAAVTVVEEGKMLSEALSTVKIQVQQMKRHLVRSVSTERPRQLISHYIVGTRPTDGRAEECECHAGRATHVLALSEAVL